MASDVNTSHGLANFDIRVKMPNWFRLSLTLLDLAPCSKLPVLAWDNVVASRTHTNVCRSIFSAVVFPWISRIFSVQLCSRYRKSPLHWNVFYNKTVHFIVILCFMSLYAILYWTHVIPFMWPPVNMLGGSPATHPSKHNGAFHTGSAQSSAQKILSWAWAEPEPSLSCAFSVNKDQLGFWVWAWNFWSELHDVQTSGSAQARLGIWAEPQAEPVWNTPIIMLYIVECQAHPALVT